MHERAHCFKETANHQLPVVAVFWIIWTVSTEEYSSLIQNLMQILWSTCSVILNVTATQYRCSFNCIYHPHWLVQWSHHCSHMCIPVHSPWLPDYIDVAQTVPVTLTMAGLFRTNFVYYSWIYRHTLFCFAFCFIVLSRCCDFTNWRQDSLPAKWLRNLQYLWAIPVWIPSDPAGIYLT